MSTFLVELPDPVPESLGDELAKRVYYVDSAIDSFSLERSGDWVTGVRITAAAGIDRAGLARKLAHVTRTEVLPQRLAVAEPVWTSAHAPSGRAGVFAELVERGAVHQMGPGAVATGEVFTGVLDAVDDTIRTIATEGFGAAQYRYPALISTSSLVKGGFPTSFPQFVMSTSRLCVDVDVYRAFAERVAGADDPVALFNQHSVHSGYCLPPTMCFHTYVQLSNRTLSHSPYVVTSRGKSFRFESRYSCSLERLWDFTIREIVFLGDSTTVTRLRQEFLDAACVLVDELGLSAQVMPANDPFFGTATVPERVLAQRLSHLKYELRAPAEDDRTVSIASFNVHGTTFGQPYRITQPTGEVAYSACVGFGLERFAFALFCQHGTDTRQWPTQVRDRLNLSNNDTAQ